MSDFYDPPSEFDIFGEKYSVVTKEENILWRGDLLYFKEAPEEDVRVYMITRAHHSTARENGQLPLKLINFAGYKAGAELVLACFPSEAAENGINIRIDWLMDNWDKFLPFGSFDNTVFYKWRSGPV